MRFSQLLNKNKWKDSIINYVVLVMIIHGCTKHSSQGPQTIRYGEMKLIPGSTFEMGGNDPQASADEFPRPMVTVDSFYMDIHENAILKVKTYLETNSN